MVKINKDGAVLKVGEVEFIDQVFFAELFACFIITFFQALLADLENFFFFQHIDFCVCIENLNVFLMSSFCHIDLICKRLKQVLFEQIIKDSSNIRHLSL